MDHSIPNHYKTLGVSPNAVSQDIKNAFFVLAKTHHPDKNNGGPTKEFVKVRTAYEVLSNRDQRNIYDGQYEKVWGDAGYQTSKSEDNFTYERYSHRGASSTSEATGKSGPKEEEERMEDNVRRTSESLDKLMKELKHISGRFERGEY